MKSNFDFGIVTIVHFGGLNLPNPGSQFGGQNLDTRKFCLIDGSVSIMK